MVRPIIAYDWSALDDESWSRYLLPMVAPQTVRIKAHAGDTAADIVARLPADLPSDVLFVFHIDLSVAAGLPTDRDALLRSLSAMGMRIANAAISDTRKTFVQNTCVRLGLRTTRAGREGNPDELLIVKTDRNYGGEPESRLADNDRIALDFQVHDTIIASDHGYRVAPRNLIKPEAWESAAYIVERYVDNAQHLFYRAYTFFDRIAISEATDVSQIRTIGKSRRLRTFYLQHVNGTLRGSLPAELVPCAESLVSFVNGIGLEIGCVDMVRDDHNGWYIIDVNPTAHWGREDEFRILDHLRQW